jgi:TonB family protein
LALLSFRVNNLGALPMRAIVLFITALSVQCAAAAPDDTPADVDESLAIAQPLRIVPPAFPKGESGETSSIRIRVEGTIGTDGVMSNPVFADSAGQEKYVAAINKVIEYWRFRPTIDRETCKAKPGPGVVLVWFESANGEQKVLVSGLRRKPAEGRVAPLFKVVRRGKPQYPTDARRNGTEGQVEVLLKLDRTGDILDRDVLSEIPDNMFASSAITSLRTMKFAPASEEQPPAKPSYCVLLPFTYCLSGSAAYPHPACRRAG